jgi:hypothetical protein
MADKACSLRLVEWNVNMSLDRKTHLLAALTPAIAILPESADSERTRDALSRIGATSVQWIGRNPNNGLTAAAFDGWTLRPDDSDDPGYQWVMPLHVSGPRTIRLLAGRLGYEPSRQRTPISAPTRRLSGIHGALRRVPYRRRGPCDDQRRLQQLGLLGHPRELDVAVALDRSMPVHGPLGLGDLFVDPTPRAPRPVVAVPGLLT